MRDEEGDVEAIVEEKDATPEQREIDEINSGILAFDAEFLVAALPRITNDNAKGEYYLTDTVGLAREDGLTVGAHLDRRRRADRGRQRPRPARRARQGAQPPHRRRAGCATASPSWTRPRPGSTPTWSSSPTSRSCPAPSCSARPWSREDAVVGPDTTLKDCEVGAGARVVRTHGELAVIGDRRHRRPVRLPAPRHRSSGSRGKIGTFVETKNAQIGDGAKVPHLSYVGDAEIGEGTNIGAGTIFANYDGVAKHRTVVGRTRKTGSNNTFVAPVAIGDGAATGGGTVVRRRRAAGRAGGQQRPAAQPSRAGRERRRAGTAQAEAARTAREQPETTEG